MRYSLLNRFQGTLGGSLLGELWCNHLLGKEEGLSAWQQMSFKLTQYLIQSHQLTQPDWEQIFQSQQNCLRANYPVNSAEIALATLPLTVFWHDSFQFLQEQLQQVAAIGQYPADLVEDVLIWGYAIALALREKLDTNRLIAQLLSRFAQAQTPLLAKLEQVDSLLDRGIGLNQAVAQLSGHHPSPQVTIALAFYCFGYTPEDFSLCMARAQQSGYQLPMTAALSSALAGAYNSFSGIPGRWRLWLKRHPASEKIEQQSKQLFSVWAGVYQPDTALVPVIAAVASPQVMQPRPSLQIISQKEP